MKIQQWIPVWTDRLESYFREKVLIHEVGHADMHISMCLVDPDGCQSYHDYYDRLTWHGLKQHKYTLVSVYKVI